MCRIFGNFGAVGLDRADLAQLSGTQYHGGPDQQDYLGGPGWSLGANRLSIQGIDGGRQPYRLGEHIIAVFNGELYNHVELRQLLRSRGYRFDDSCDGSLLPALYLEFGDAFVERLDGMFALAVLDLRAPRLLLATDPTGVKSLYYWATDDDFVFSSEVGPLVRLPRVKTEVVAESIDLYLSMLAVLGERTAFRGVNQLGPGQRLVVRAEGGYRVEGYRPALGELPADGDDRQVGDRLRVLLDDEVRRMQSADVPVCLITSGGLDSSLLTALAARHHRELTAFNITYRGDWPGDERHYGALVARHCGVRYHQVEADPAGFPELMPAMVAHLGQPNAAPHSLSTYILFREVQAAGFRVAIAGEGADEMFGGYQRFARAAAGGPGWSDRYLDIMSAVPLALRRRLYTESFAAHLAAEGTRSGEIRAEMAALGDPPGLEPLLEFDRIRRFPYYILRRVDHLSMASAVEVRVPFCQPRVAGLARALPDRMKISGTEVKRAVYAAAEPLLPEAVRNRPKQPFTLPVAAMLRPGQPLFEYLTARLNDSADLPDYLSRARLAELVAVQAAGPDETAAKALWAVLVLDLWLEHARGLLAGG